MSGHRIEPRDDLGHLGRVNLDRARRFKTRWMLSAMFNHDSLTGEYSGMIPCSNSQQTNFGVL